MITVRSMTLAIAFWAASSALAADLGETLKQKLPLLGHRNWIVIADSAFPVYSDPAIETIYVGGDQLKAVATALQAIRASKHVRARVVLDAELAAVPESDAPGVGRYRDELKQLLGRNEPERIPHEAVLKQLDETGKTFQVLIIKTDFTIPYTSVFVQLDCGYWSNEAEQRLRKALDSK